MGETLKTIKAAFTNAISLLKVQMFSALIKRWQKQVISKYTCS